MQKVVCAAGILPISFVDGQPCALVGQEADDGTWSDFGGKRDRGEMPWACAVRECFEESAGLLNFSHVHKCATRYIDVPALNSRARKYYRIYLLFMHHDTILPDTFAAQRARLAAIVPVPSVYIEKSQIAWVPLRTLIYQARSRSPHLRHTFGIALRMFGDKIWQLSQTASAT